MKTLKLFFLRLAFALRLLSVKALILFLVLNSWDVSSAAASPASSKGPGEAQSPWRGTNIVRLQGNSLCDSTGPFLGLGVSYFQALRDAKYDRARLNSNLALLASKGFNYVRILSMVSWDGMEIAPVAFTNRLGRVVPAWPDYWQQFRDLLDLAGRHGLRAEVTIFADAQYVMPAQAARQAHLDGILASITGRENQVMYLEVANEAWQNGFPGVKGIADLRAFTQYLANRTQVLVAITSNDDTTEAGIISLYRGSASDLATVHFSRDTRTAEGGWMPVRDTYRAGNLPGVPPVISNEPIGPGSSVSSESDPIKLCSAAVFAYLANLPGYVFHSRAGIYGYEKCCPPTGSQLRFEQVPGIDAFQHIRQLLPPDLANWIRNDGIEPRALFTVSCNGKPNSYWPEVSGPTNGCVRNSGSSKGDEFVCLPMGILAGGVTLEARRAMRFGVYDLLTGAVVSNLVLDAGKAFTLPQGPGAYLIKGKVQEISWSAPTDGGTPREPERIQQVGPREFHIRAAFEEGGQSSLRHAVSRVDLVCRNAGRESATVTVHLDLSGDGKRTDYDTRPESGMRQRDFLFIQPPGQNWQQVDGTTTGWVATVSFQALPGETKVGLSPWYTYGDYLGFVHGLPQSALLQQKVVGKSDGGREHWELTLTDSAIPAEKKQRIFWHAREHAYETYSSFAMEGLVQFLLSEEAAEFRQRYLFTLHPMTNPDGVAQGFEYRGGYDFPKPRGTASARLTFEAIDRLRPDFAVAWHNWVAPRDRDVVFYTDGDQGKPTARAWYLFAQKFPSPRAADHHWKDETTPARYNWEGKTPLSEANVHQYAMKKYGTQVWGWEMPWWHRSPEDARRAGAAFARAFLATLGELRAGKQLPAPESVILLVPRWEIHEFTIQARAHVANPFRDAAFVGEFTSPSGKTNVVDGFYDGGNTWRLRFAPDEEGQWTYLLRGEGIEAFQRGRLRCTASRGHGFLRIHPENPYAFAHTDGTPFFPMGDTCYGLFDDSPITAELRDDHLKTRRAQRFNFVRMTVGHSQSRAAADPAYWAWGGTVQKPDLDRLNPVFFQWFNPRTGSTGASFTIPGGEQHKFDSPDASDWVLLLKRT